jgi:hypothetical protein
VYSLQLKTEMGRNRGEAIQTKEITVEKLGRWTLKAKKSQ